MTQTLAILTPFVFEGLNCCCFYSWTLKAVLCCLVQLSPFSHLQLTAFGFKQSSPWRSPHEAGSAGSCPRRAQQSWWGWEGSRVWRHQGLPEGITALLWCFGFGLVSNALMFKENSNLI